MRSCDPPLQPLSGCRLRVRLLYHLPSVSTSRSSSSSHLLLNMRMQILGHSESHCVSASHLPSYVFTTSSMVRHVAFRFKRSSQASHQPYSPFALRQQPQFCPQYPKCDLGDQYKNLLNIWHSWQYQLYQCGLHSVHGQSASKLCAPR